MLRWFLHANAAKAERKQEAEWAKEERLFRASITKEDRDFAKRMRRNAATKIQAALRMMMEKAIYPLRLAMAGLHDSARKFGQRYTVARRLQ